MDDEAARAALDALIRDRREDYAGLSRLLGRNPAYLQQYVKRGTPRRLAEADRATLARYFAVDEEALGAPPRAPAAALVHVPRFTLGASAGPGALDDEVPPTAMALPRAFLRELGLPAGAALSMIRVMGDSMLPTLADGDDILVDRDDGADRLRDGIYVLRLDGTLLVKRLAVRPGTLAVLSDNPAYPPWTADRATLSIIGRVVWSARRVR